MRFILSWLGICCAVIGVLSIVFQHDISPEENILNIPESMMLVLLGILFMYLGREYLFAWLGYFWGSDGDND